MEQEADCPGMCIPPLSLFGSGRTHPELAGPEKSSSFRILNCFVTGMKADFDDALFVEFGRTVAVDFVQWREFHFGEVLARGAETVPVTGAGSSGLGQARRGQSQCHSWDRRGARILQTLKSPGGACGRRRSSTTCISTSKAHVCQPSSDAGHSAAGGGAPARPRSGANDVALRACQRPGRRGRRRTHRRGDGGNP